MMSTPRTSVSGSPTGVSTLIKLKRGLGGKGPTRRQSTNDELSHVVGDDGDTTFGGGEIPLKFIAIILPALSEVEIHILNGGYTTRLCMAQDPDLDLSSAHYRRIQFPFKTLQRLFMHMVYSPLPIGKLIASR